MPRTSCRVCGAALPPGGPAGGRPHVFCSSRCRRLHGYELRRVERRMKRVDDQVREHEAGRRDGALPMACCLLDGVDEHLSRLAAERDRLTQQLAILLDNTEAVTT